MKYGKIAIIAKKTEPGKVILVKIEYSLHPFSVQLPTSWSNWHFSYVKISIYVMKTYICTINMIRWTT